MNKTIEIGTADSVGGAIRHVRAGSPIAARPYRVKSQRRGCQIHWTEEYWKSPRVFGAGLSIPVDGYLADGRYRFGGSPSGNVPITWDRGIHEVSATKRETTLIAI